MFKKTKDKLNFLKNEKLKYVFMAKLGSYIKLKCIHTQQGFVWFKLYFYSKIDFFKVNYTSVLCLLS